MSQHSPEAGDMSNGSWLPLIEYSVRSGLSLSTIRRKIKSNSLQYRMENGRYLIFFEEGGRTAPRPQTTMPVAPPSSAKWDDEPARPEPFRPEPSRAHESVRFAPAPRDGKADEIRPTTSGVDSAVRMVSEAFEHALREKDERILLLEKANRDLEERLLELRLLVKVLEEKYEVRY